MKLRRALAAAAVTAAIAPAALLAAPAAFADPEPTPTATVEPTQDPAPTTDPTADPKPDPDPEPTQTSTPSPEPTKTPSTDAPTPTDKPTATPEPTQSATGKPTPTPSPTDEGEDPTCTEDSDEGAISTTLRGLPNKVVAGAGWVNFTFRTTNTSDRTMKSVDAFAIVGAVSGEDFEDVSELLTIEWYDEASGSWQPVEDGGYFATVEELKPDEYADAKMRLKVDAKTPGSYGFALAIGAYQDENNLCGFSEGSEYTFDVVTAGSKPGPVEDAKPKPSKRKPNKPAPQGERSKLPVTGELAHTGSSSMMPTLAVIGGVTVAVGAGAMIVVRRRRTAGAAA